MKLRLLSIVALVVVIAASYFIKRATQRPDPKSIDETPVNTRIKRAPADSAYRPKSRQPNEVILTMDGWDQASKSTINRINLWENYQTRTFAGSVRHGEKVKLIRREGDGVLIETKSGTRGWVTYFFIKEYRN